MLKIAKIRSETFPRIGLGSFKMDVNSNQAGDHNLLQSPVGIYAVAFSSEKYHRRVA